MSYLGNTGNYQILSLKKIAVCFIKFYLRVIIAFAAFNDSSNSLQNITATAYNLAGSYLIQNNFQIKLLASVNEIERNHWLAQQKLKNCITLGDKMVEEHYCKFPDNIFQSVFKPHKFQHCFRLESTVYDKVFLLNKIFILYCHFIFKPWTFEIYQHFF